MKTLLVMVVVFSSACFSSVKPSRPAPPVPEAGGPPPQITDGMGNNGTRLTGLTQGDRAGTIHTLTLPSGEVIKLQ